MHMGYVGATEAGSGQPGWATAVENLLSTAVKGFTAVTSAKSAADIQKVNVQRAQQGLLPINTAMYQQPLYVQTALTNPLASGLGVRTNTMLLLVAAGLAAFLILRRK